MSDNAIGLLVFVCIFGASLLGLLLRHGLSPHHLSSETKDTVKLAMGLVGTMAALLLGLSWRPPRAPTTPRGTK